MKRLFTALLVSALLLSLPACGRTESPVETPSQQEVPAPPAEALPEVPEEPALPEPPPPTAEELEAAALEERLASLSLEEKVGQLFFVRCPAENAVEDIQTYHLGGYLLFGRDFKDTAGSWLTREQFAETIQAYQTAALADNGIPLLIGSDEEGGSVTRASRNPNLFDRVFPSPQWLRNHQQPDQGNLFVEDAWDKTGALLQLGINVNLAPVADVSTDPKDFIYDRSLGQDAEATAEYVRAVVSTITGCGMGSVLKHFPGYGNNVDTHTGIAIDQRPLDQFLAEDLLPFRSGVAAGVQPPFGQRAAVLVSHNIVTCMDENLPASLSPAVHEILRKELDFDGVVMTDDLAMEAVSAYAEDGAVAVMAIEAGNDLIITSDYRTQIPKVLEAVESGRLSEETVDAACLRVLRWKVALGLLEP